MDLTFDPSHWLPTPRASDPGGAAGFARPEWPVLAARLAAAHALQRHSLREERFTATARKAGDTISQTGSFHADAARALFGFRPVSGVIPYGAAGMVSDEDSGLTRVNPTSSNDRNGTNGMLFNIAGPPSSGNRGLK